MSDENTTPSSDMNNISTGTLTFGLAMMSLVVVTAIFFMVWVLYHRKTRVVRTMQPIFLIPIIVGLIITTLAIIPLGISSASTSDVSAACRAIPWLLGIGTTVELSALFSKLWRINKIFHASNSFQRKVVKPKDVLWPFAILFSINLFALLVRTIMDPLNWVRKNGNGSEDIMTGFATADFYGTCEQGSLGDVMEFLQIAVNVTSLLILCIQSYRAWDISSEFSEARGVALALISWLQVYMVAMPALLLIEPQNTTALFVINVLLLVIPHMSMLLFVFGPIVLHHRRIQRQATALKANVRISGLNLVHGDKAEQTPPLDDIFPEASPSSDKKEHEGADVNSTSKNGRQTQIGSTEVLHGNGSPSPDLTATLGQIEDLESQIEVLRKRNDELEHLVNQ